MHQGLQLPVILGGQSPDTTSTTSAVSAVSVVPAVNWTELTTVEVVDKAELVEAKRILDTYRSFPACHRDASSHFIEVITFVGQYQTEELRLAEVRVWYAAQMALCEIKEAGDVPPAECLDMQIPVIRDFENYDLVPIPHLRSDMEVCVKALKSEPQTWTSFSNNRQNANALTYLARQDIERQWNIDLFSDFIGIVKTATASMQTHIAHLFSFQQQLEVVMNDTLVQQELLNTSVTSLREEFTQFSKDLDNQTSRTWSYVANVNSQLIDTVSMASSFVISIQQGFTGILNMMDFVVQTTTEYATNVSVTTSKNLANVEKLQASIEAANVKVHNISNELGRLDKIMDTFNSVVYLVPYVLIFAAIRATTGFFPLARAWLMFAFGSCPRP